MSQFSPLDVETLLRVLPLSDKVKLLGGKDEWHFEDVLEFGIPALRTSDGPNGIRGQYCFNGTLAAVTPCATGLAASFDPDLLKRVGVLLGEECIAKGAHCLLGPTVNIQRSPLGGRGFESFSEDPHLSGMLASSYIAGVQSKGVLTTLKHFVANDQEFERFSIDAVVSQRALREIYLEPFRLAVKHSSPHAIMTSYSRCNGIHVSEDPFLLQEVLRKEWKYDGLIMSDWTGVYSTAPSIKAGLDIEMPGPPVQRGETVKRQFGAGKITLDDIDRLVRNILNFINKAIASQIPFYAKELSNDTPELRAQLREAAANAVVLLKNDNGVLPLAKGSGLKKIAVIGSNAKYAVPSGGGSASLAATYTISPLQGIQAAASTLGVEVEYATGASAFRYLPLLDPFMTDAMVRFYIQSPVKDWFHDIEELPVADYEVGTASSFAFMTDSVPYDRLGPGPVCQYSATFTPDVSGTWLLSLSTIGIATLFVDGDLVIENLKDVKLGGLFFNMGSEEVIVKRELVAGTPVKLLVRQYLDPKTVHASPFPVKGGIRLGSVFEQTPENARAEAVELAKNSDVAIVVVGNDADIEAEGFDRTSMAIPGKSDTLVRALLAANPRTIVVTQSGTPLAMPWLEEAPTLVHAFFGGNELGSGLADILFGTVNPSGKLPITFPVRLEDNPSFHSFGVTSETPGKVNYAEGIYVGYRHYERSLLKPAFPFGFGLSYTTFSISDLSVSEVSSTATFCLSFKITNTGKIGGAEVAQVYISAPVEGRITSPRKELKGFKKAFLAAGKSETVTVELEKEAFSYWDEAVNSWVAPAGNYGVLVGSSSADIALIGEAVLLNTIRWTGL